jgi:hypothetical protein
MPIENLNAQHYTLTEKQGFLSSMDAMEKQVATKFKNLSPEERTRYGSINEQNKLFVNKVKDYRANQPLLCSPDIDWVEFQNDMDSREFLQNAIARLESLLQSIRNNKILHDHDCYQVALTEYEYSKYRLGTKAIGFEVKVNDLAQFFSRTKVVSTPTKIKEIE